METHGIFFLMSQFINLWKENFQIENNDSTLIMVILLEYDYYNKMHSRFPEQWQLSNTNIFFPENRFSVVFFKDKLLSYCLSEHC